MYCLIHRIVRQGTVGAVDQALGGIVGDGGIVASIDSGTGIVVACIAGNGAISEDLNAISRVIENYVIHDGAAVGCPDAARPIIFDLVTLDHTTIRGPDTK